MRAIDEALDMTSGYVLNFSDRTMAEYFEDHFGIEIYDEKYRFNGTSKAKHLRAFIAVEDAPVVSFVLRNLWEYRSTLPVYVDAAEENAAAERAKEQAFLRVLHRIEGSNGISSTDVLERFKSDYSLEELISAIERDIAANKAAAALDRLHTYCMKKFSHLLEQRGHGCDRTEALHARVGKYVKAVESERQLGEMTKRIIKSSISIFDQFNQVRNEQSLAHDNDLVGPIEAKFIFDSVCAILRFIKAMEATKYGA
ncbi:MAG TPA: abortive infection family protein [Verrucomicrobiae bacterium]|nr:abortive infection family protein [Verrucomicrobiae bacterium]